MSSLSTVWLQDRDPRWRPQKLQKSPDEIGLTFPKISLRLQLWHVIVHKIWCCMASILTFLSNTFFFLNFPVLNENIQPCWSYCNFSNLAHLIVLISFNHFGATCGGFRRFWENQETQGGEVRCSHVMWCHNHIWRTSKETFWSYYTRYRRLVVIALTLWK